MKSRTASRNFSNAHIFVILGSARFFGPRTYGAPTVWQRHQEKASLA
jgi:hypothetical protein